MTVFYPLSALRATSPEGGSKVCLYCLCEQSEAISREGVGLRRHILLTLVVGYFADAQYDILLLPPSGEVSATPTIGDKSAR